METNTTTNKEQTMETTKNSFAEALAEMLRVWKWTEDRVKMMYPKASQEKVGEIVGKLMTESLFGR